MRRKRRGCGVCGGLALPILVIVIQCIVNFIVVGDIAVPILQDRSSVVVVDIVVVVTDGQIRYGRGPCFGDVDDAVDQRQNIRQFAHRLVVRSR